MRSDWHRVRDIFERALEEEPADLETWLAREAPDNPDVRAEVRSLLDHHSTAGQFLNVPVSDRFPSLLNEDHPYEAEHVIGHYTIVRELGHGGMGRVYLATDARLRRRVALKALAHRFTGNPAHKERLRREARTAAGLTHRGICTVYELYEHEGDLFIASEYVEGHTLRDEIDDGQRPQGAEVLQTARDIAEALAFAHAHGIVHRDLKPENVMRTGDGSIKILDFGLARLDGSETDPNATQVTEQGAVVGTVGYMAPERLNGKPGDARADVFAFGVVLYELACGVHPFPGSSHAEVTAQILQSNPISIEDRCPGLPPSVWAVIERCLRKLPTQRFVSASEIPAALGDERPTRHEAAVRWWRNHQAIIVGLYFLASVVAWFIKQGLGTPALVVFGVVGVAATVGGLLRGHLLFVERTTPRTLAAELRRTGLITLVTDAVIFGALIVDSVLLLASGRHLAAVLIAGLGIVIVLTRRVLEPSTTAAAFGPVNRVG